MVISFYWRDFYFLNELSKNEEKDVNAYIEKCENEIKTRIGEELKKMKQFDPSEKVEFHKLNIKEISLEDIKTIEDINNLRLELNRVIISRDNFKTIYDQCIKTKESQRLEFITLMSINIESLLIQLPTPIK